MQKIMLRLCYAAGFYFLILYFMMLGSLFLSFVLITIYVFGNNYTESISVLELANYIGDGVQF